MLSLSMRGEGKLRLIEQHRQLEARVAQVAVARCLPAQQQRGKVVARQVELDDEGHLQRSSEL